MEYQLKCYIHIKGCVKIFIYCRVHTVYSNNRVKFIPHCLSFIPVCRLNLTATATYMYYFALYQIKVKINDVDINLSNNRNTNNMLLLRIFILLIPLTLLQSTAFKNVSAEAEALIQ